MAVPKRRTSHARQGKRRSHHHKTPIQIQYCSRCERAGAAAPRLPQLRLLPGPRGRAGRRGEVSHADRAGRDGRRPRPRADRRRRRAGRRRRPRPARRAGRRPGPGRAAVCRGAAGRDRLEIFHCTQVVGMEETPGRGPAQEARQLHQPLLATARRAQGRRHRQRRQHRRHGGRRPAPAALPARTCAGPASPPSCRRLQGPVRPARRRRQRQPQAGAPVPVRRHGQHLRQAHPPAASSRPSA